MLVQEFDDGVLTKVDLEAILPDLDFLFGRQLRPLPV
jgi:hypothetical protein